MQLRIRTDSSVCKAIGARRGVGKIRHLHVKSLWLQNVIKAGDAFLEKIGTKDNRADLGTKVHSAPEFERLMELNSIYEFKDKEKYLLKSVQKVGGIVSKSTRAWGSPPRNPECRQCSATTEAIKVLLASRRSCCNTEGG